MSTETTTALELLRQVLGQFTDAAPEHIVPEAELASLELDSLALAEMLFALEDKLGITMNEPPTPPKTVADVLVLIEPHMDALRANASAL